MEFIGGEQVEGGGVGGKLKVGNTIHKETNSSSMFSISSAEKSN